MYRYVEVLLKCSNSHTFPMSLGCLKQLLMDLSMIYTELYSACVSWTRPNQFSWFRQQTDSPTLNSRHWLRQMLKLFWKHQRATVFTVFRKLTYNWFGYTVVVSAHTLPLRRYFCLLFLWTLEMTFITISIQQYHIYSTILNYIFKIDLDFIMCRTDYLTNIIHSKHWV